jgi:hypothetical protein
MRTSPIRIAVAGFAAGAQAGPRAVVELFTSQGCPSCPPADELLTKLARDPDLIALLMPVDYFDQPGWKEKLSRHAIGLGSRRSAIGFQPIDDRIGARD